jgi:hypothetical protein
VNMISSSVRSFAKTTKTLDTLLYQNKHCIGRWLVVDDQEVGVSKTDENE